MTKNKSVLLQVLIWGSQLGENAVDIVPPKYKPLTIMIAGMLSVLVNYLASESDPRTGERLK